MGDLGLRRIVICAMVVTVASATGCSKKVIDVGEDVDTGPIYAESAPPLREETDAASEPLWKLVDREWDIVNLAVDGGRVFWVAEYFDVGSIADARRRILAMQSCDISNCKRTFRTLDVYDDGNPGGYNTNASMLVVLNTHSTFWRDLKTGGGVAKCSRSLETLDYLNPMPDSRVVLTFAVDDVYLYFAADERLSSTPNGISVGSCAIEDCADTVSRLQMSPPPGESAYLGTSRMVLDGEYLYLVSSTRIVRTRKDGSGDFEVIVRGQQTVTDMALKDGAVYWAASSEGSIRTCPVTGCAGDPRVVVSNLLGLRHLALDDEYVYFTDSIDPSLRTSGRLLRCPIPGCDVPDVIAEGQGINGPVVTDDDFVYFSGNERDPVRPAGSQFDSPLSYIGVRRK